MIVHRLANGQQVCIRPIRPDDKWQLQEGLKRLSLETIHRRFLAAKPRFSSAELRYLTEVDGVNHIALVAISMATGRLVAVGPRRARPRGPGVRGVGDRRRRPAAAPGPGHAADAGARRRCREQGIQRFSALIDGENRGRPAAAGARRQVPHVGASGRLIYSG